MAQITEYTIMNTRIPRPRNTIYLDHAAATPVRPEVIRAMQPYWAKEFGNPSTLYSLGQRAHAALTAARNTVATALEAAPREIVFTAGGSEGDTLAILGSARAYRAAHAQGGHLITTTIEHHAVLAAVNAAKGLGIRVTILPTNPEGYISPEDVRVALEPDTFLVSVMFANNEVGTIEPIAEISRILKKVNAERSTAQHSPILLHTDACQAAGYLDISVRSLGVDLLTLNGSKIYGPKQTGVLYVRNGTPLMPIVYGGGQELGLRSGTENVPGAVGFARALALAQKERTKESARICRLRNSLAMRMQKLIPGLRINGPALDEPSTPAHRLPNNLNVSFTDCDGEAMVLYLDAYNIAVATGSACATGSTEPSHVLAALGLTPADIRGSLRFTLGKSTTQADILVTCKILAHIVTQQRNTTTML